MSDPATHTLDLAIAGVLAAHRLARIDARHRTEDVLASTRNRVVVTGRRLHRDECEHLQKVVLDDVAYRADRVVKRAAILDAEVLRHRDLDRRDVLTVPDRLEHGVGEPEVHDVLHRLLAQEVVDPEQALLGEDRGQALVQVARRGQVGPERLLDHETAGVTDEASLRQLLGDLVEHRRRRREVEDGKLRPGKCGAQAVVERVLLGLGIAADVLHARQELGEGCVVDLFVGRLDRLRRMPPQLVVRHGSASHADHRACEQPLLRERVEGRERAPAREIAGDPEDDECVGGARHAARSDCAAERSMSTPSSRSSTGIRSLAEWMSVAARSVSIAFIGK